MKAPYLLTVITCLVFATFLNAQEDAEMKYIFSGGKKIEISGFIGPIMEFSAIQNDFAFFMGGGGGLMFNQKFYFGGYGEGLTTIHSSDYWIYDAFSGSYYPTDGNITFGHGGFWLGYILHPQKPIHFCFSSKIGWGAINTFQDVEIEPYKDEYDDSHIDHVFVAIPQVEVEFNFTKWFKANIGVGYRIVAGIDKELISKDKDPLPLYDKKDYNKPEGTITLCFGYFK